MDRKTLIAVAWLVAFLVWYGASDACAQCRIVNGRMQCNQQAGYAQPRLLQRWMPAQYRQPTLAYEYVQPQTCQIINGEMVCDPQASYSRPLPVRPRYAPSRLFARPRYW